MELRRAWWLEAQIRDRGIEAKCLLWVCETLATASAGAAVPGCFSERARQSARARLAAAAGSVSTLDLLGPGLTLLTGSIARAGMRQRPALVVRCRSSPAPGRDQRTCDGARLDRPASDGAADPAKWIIV